VNATEKPTWPKYAADLAARLGGDTLDMPSALVVGILGFVAEDERVDEHERAMCKAWLNRLVDEEGNPLDDKLRNAFEHVGQENLLASSGQLSYIEREPDRVAMTIVVSRRAATLDREVLREKLVPHAESYVDHLLDALFAGETPSV
jgi:hypothetical protein